MSPADNKARIWLTHEYPEDYRKFYLEAKRCLIRSGVSGHLGSKAQSRAVVKLTHTYPKRFKELRIKAKDAGYSVTTYSKKLRKEVND